MPSTIVRAALKMRQVLYPKTKYPHGHTELANSLNNLGALLISQGFFAQGHTFYLEALKMRHDLYHLAARVRHPTGIAMQLRRLLMLEVAARIAFVRRQQLLTHINAEG